jgi:hypothetical protein
MENYKVKCTNNETNVYDRNNRNAKKLKTFDIQRKLCINILIWKNIHKNNWGNYVYFLISSFLGSGPDSMKMLC